MRDVKVVIFLEKARNPFAGMVGWLERLRDVRFNRKQDIGERSASRSPEKHVRLRDVRLVNLLKR
jgi:hypothetical protein